MKRYRFRFKTRKEFVDEYGIYWMSKVPNNWNEDMNIYLGKPLEIDNDELLNKLENRKGYIVDYDKDSYRDWTICIEMLVKIDYTPSYKPKRIIRNL